MTDLYITIYLIVAAFVFVGILVFDGYVGHDFGNSGPSALFMAVAWPVIGTIGFMICIAYLPHNLGSFIRSRTR